MRAGRGIVFAYSLLATIVLIAVPRGATGEDLFERQVTPRQLLENVLSQPAAELSTTRVLSGQFVQRRFLNGLARPLISRGDFLLAREQGILWRTREPFASEFLLTSAGMTLRDGTNELRVSDADRPALRTALDMLLAIFALDVESLSAGFELYGLKHDDRWQVGLRPRDGGLAQVFSRAVITGARHVERIELATAGGDRTEIELTDVATRSTPLDAAEAARFHP